MDTVDPKLDHWQEVAEEEIKIGIDAVKQAIFNQRVVSRIQEATKWAICHDGVEYIGVMQMPLKHYIELIIQEEAL